MTSREQFEAHFPWKEDELRSEGGRYLDSSVQLHWLTWQASRQALVVELPEPVSQYEWMRKQCIAAIEATGVRVKS